MNTYVVDRVETLPSLPYGKSYFDTKKGVLRLLMIQHKRIIECDFDKMLLIGRMVEETDLDLSIFGGVAMGISRRHALVIKHNVTLMVQDLRSTNGTILNGERLTPNLPVVLRDGDHLTLGLLQMRVMFALKETN